VVFLPLISITGVTGTFFRALAVTMGVSLFTSLALALTWTPSLSQYFIRKHGITRREEIADGSFRNQLLAAEEASLGGFFRKIIDFHQRWLWRALENRKWLAVISLSLIAISYICYRFSGSDLLPEMDEGGFTLDYWTPAGSSLRETDRMVTAS
jgi:multidrug efflux pump subunit AcrB